MPYVVELPPNCYAYLSLFSFRSALSVLVLAVILLSTELDRWTIIQYGAVASCDRFCL